MSEIVSKNNVDNDFNNASFLSSFRSRAAALVLTLATPLSLLSISGCSPSGKEESGIELNSKPAFSTLGLGKDEKIKIEDLSTRLANLGEVHKSLQAALSKLISLGSGFSEEGFSYFQKENSNLAQIKQDLQNAHRTLLNASNQPEFSAVKNRFNNMAQLITDFSITISTPELINKNWNTSNGDIPGPEVALRTQVGLEEIITSIGEDIGALLPGLNLSKAINLTQTLGSLSGTLKTLQDLNQQPEVDLQTLSKCRSDLGRSIAHLEIASKDEDLKAYSASFPGLITKLSSLHTGLLKETDASSLKSILASAQDSLKELKLTENSVNKELDKKDPNGTTRSTGFFYPYAYHYFYTGHSSWSGSESHYASPRSSVNAGLTKSSGFRSGSSGVRTGGFGSRGSSFSGGGGGRSIGG